MDFDNLKGELSDFVGRELHELAWRRYYPIHPFVGLGCFFDAFKDCCGAKVVVDDRRKVANFQLVTYLCGDVRMFQTSRTYDEILTGWKNGAKANPKGCPSSFYDSICQVYDNIEDEFLRTPENHWGMNDERGEWHHIRNVDSKKVRRKMEDLLVPYFCRYHEHMLVPVSGKIPELRKPEVFLQIMKDFPIDVLDNAIMNKDCCNGAYSLTPCEDTLLDVDWNEFEIGSYYPSESVMMGYFWGKYLETLQKEKGYPFYYDEDPLRQLVVRGCDAFKLGSQITWG